MGVLWTWSPQRASTQAVVLSKVYSSRYGGLYWVTVPTLNSWDRLCCSNLGREWAQVGSRHIPWAPPPRRAARLTTSSGCRRCSRRGRGTARSSGIPCSCCISSSRRRAGLSRCLRDRAVAGGSCIPNSIPCMEGELVWRFPACRVAQTGNQPLHQRFSPQAPRVPPPRHRCHRPRLLPAASGDSPSVLRPCGFG